MATVIDTINGNRLPPQAPSSRHARHRSTSADRMAVGTENNNGSGSSGTKSSRKSKSGSKSRRGRSSSDGVRMMEQRYQQQQQHQQYYYGGYQNQNNNNYPMQYPNNQPYSGQPIQQSRGMPPHSQSERGRGSSFDAANGYPIDQTMGGSGGYGSIPPPPSRPRTNSKEFSAMNELSSIIGRSSNNVAQRSPVSGRKGGHRRTMSDSMVGPPRQQQQQQPLTIPPYQGGVNNNNMVVMPNPNYGGPLGNGQDNRIRADSYGSQGSYHSQISFHGPPDGNEMEAILARHNAEQGYNNKQSSKRPSMHMRQNSVNVYMKSFKGVKQPKALKDVMWGIIFLLQLAIMCIVGIRYGPEALVPSAEDLGAGEGLDDNVDLEPLLEGTEEGVDDAKIVLAYQNIVKMAYTCGAFAIIVSALALAFMMAMSRRLVYVALVLSIGVSFAWGTIGIGISPKSFVPITGIIALMLTVGYMFVVWDRIPFASANLTTALTGVRDNLGLVGVAFLYQFLALVASIYYTFTFVGLHDAMHNGDLLGKVSDNMMWAIDIILFVSYYWTYQVLRHIVIVTVAGTIESWWFQKPSALRETFTRAIFYNFGSICYGSLFVGFVQFLRQITEGMRPNHGDSSLMCLYECSLFFQERIVSFVDNLADSFTPWAFTYVGIYHYGLKEAGHKANELFDNRGWSRIVTDDLIASVLAMVSLVIGGLCGSFAVILQALDGHGLTSFGHPVLVSFTIGFLVGIVLSTVLFSIIDSSVCAVIVCFAGSPVEFHHNHRELSHEMRQSWKEVWPGSVDLENVGPGTSPRTRPTL